MTLSAIQRQQPHNRMRSERKRTPKMLNAICELVRNRLSWRHAGEKLHLHHSTIGRWRNELPDFDAAILAAEAEFIEAQVANIRTAAKTSWQASAWLLERKFPESFSQPQVQLNMPVARNEDDDFAEMLRRFRETSMFKRIAADNKAFQNILEDSIIDVPALPVHGGEEQH
jgi:hypothetical protein